MSSKNCWPDPPRRNGRLRPEGPVGRVGPASIIYPVSAWPKWAVEG